jgi:primosomal protein N' (replication factor Y)
MSAEISIGARLAVPLRRKIYSGIALILHDNPPPYPTKDVIAIIDATPIVGSTQLLMWQWTAQYYMCSIGEVMKAALPASLKLESETRIALVGEAADICDTANLDANQTAIVNFLRHKESVCIEEMNDIISDIMSKKHLLSTIESLLRQEIITICEHLRDTYKPKMVVFNALHPSILCEDDINDLFTTFKRSPQQEKLLLAYLSLAVPLSFEHPQWIPRHALLAAANVKPSTLKTAIRKNIFVEMQQEENSPLPQEISACTMPQLSPAQAAALSDINECFQTKNVVLLHGVTSSGKTEIYIHLIQQALQENKQVLYLVPEISLTMQLIVRLKKVFGEAVGIYHSKFSDNERAKVYYSLLRCEIKIVLGVRSSVFLPFSSLGLIIVDEEHEQTYKQSDPAPRYHARDFAIMTALQTNARVLLGSATPSIESAYNAQTIGKYGYVTLTHRYGGAEMPQIVMVNISGMRTSKGGSVFSPFLVNEIEKCIDNHQQVLLFQNRRGFAPYLECRDCGWTMGCEHCSVALVYHKRENSMVCHYCGFSAPVPHTCLACDSVGLMTKGIGTEKVEEELRIIFPAAAIERMDLDTARTRTSMQRIIADFESGQTQILVGTQMITKGLDFDNVGLVGVLDADGMLSYPDFRSAERCFQSLVQVAGRAGRRGSGGGKVLVQTRMPLHPLLQQVRDSNYDDMFDSQLAERSKFGYPPFVRLVRIVLKHKDERLLGRAAAALDGLLRGVFAPQYVLGPQPPLVNKVRNLYILHFLVKISRDTNLAAAKELLSLQIVAMLAHQDYRSVAANVDVDA